MYRLRTLNWKIFTVVFVLLTLSTVGVIWGASRLSSPENVKRVGVEEVPLGKGREDASYEQPRQSIAENYDFTMTSDVTATISPTRVPDGEFEDFKPDAEVITGGTFTTPGSTYYSLMSRDFSLTVDVGEFEKFYINGVPASTQVDFSTALLSILRDESSGRLVTYGTFSGDNGQQGAYVLSASSDAQVGGETILTFYLTDRSKVLRIQGATQYQELPHWLRTLSLTLHDEISEEGLELWATTTSNEE